MMLRRTLTELSIIPFPSHTTLVVTKTGSSVIKVNHQNEKYICWKFFVSEFCVGVEKTRSTKKAMNTKERLTNLATTHKSFLAFVFQNIFNIYYIGLSVSTMLKSLFTMD